MEERAKLYGRLVVFSSWLAIFCLFVFRSSFAALKGPLGASLKLTATQGTLGFGILMSVYAIAAYFSGKILDKWGTNITYFVAAIFGGAAFILTSKSAQFGGFYFYLFSYGVLGGICNGMLWVSSTVSVRKWYIGRYYATMFGFAFAGGPMSQVVSSYLVKDFLKTSPDRWTDVMWLLGVIVLIAMVIAALISKKGPEAYGMKPFGEMPAPAGGAAKAEYVWKVGEAFGTYPIWAAILTFMTSMIGEFLIWSQVISFWVEDAKLNITQAINMYMIIGIVGIFSMPILGKVADKMVQICGLEALGRKRMLQIGPLTGAIACAILLAQLSGAVWLGYVSCIIFAIYWAIVPGGVVGYTGSIYGRRTLGGIWGLATLIVMGIGPITGAMVGAGFKDIFGTYKYSIVFAMCAFILSMLLATSMPLKATPKGATE